MLLQTGQLLSNVGTQATSIAYPLLVLAVTHSAAKAGTVAFARSLAWALFALPAGVAADRWSRRRLMIAADAARVVAIGSLAATILLDRLRFWPIALVAFVGGRAARRPSARWSAVRACPRAAVRRQLRSPMRSRTSRRSG
jgi:MFS family permease